MLAKRRRASKNPTSRNNRAGPLMARRRQTVMQFAYDLRPAFIICTALFFYLKVSVHCLLHGFLDTCLLIYSWCDIARNRVGTIIGR